MTTIVVGVVVLLMMFKEAWYWSKVNQVFTTTEAINIMLLTSVGWVLILWGVMFL